MPPKHKLSFLLMLVFLLCFLALSTQPPSPVCCPYPVTCCVLPREHRCRTSACHDPDTITPASHPSACCLLIPVMSGATTRLTVQTSILSASCSPCLPAKSRLCSSLSFKPLREAPHSYPTSLRGSNSGIFISLLNYGTSPLPVMSFPIFNPQSLFFLS